MTTRTVPPVTTHHARSLWMASCIALGGFVQIIRNITG